ncbi:MAG TPA: pantoate--beta-alanine ligase [Ktedonobacteraceae bacterium]
MRVITTVQEMLGARADRSVSDRWGLVPTMGYLHEGHLSLVRQAREESAMLAVSIFVNPAQFGPREDLGRYPRDLPRDLRLLEECGVDIVFAPAVEDMYPPGFATYVDPYGPLVAAAEGASRPGHFRGVATVVLKLFQILNPQRAYFGQKDAQQVAVLARMVADLCLPVTLRIFPTVREADGLALSSRNAYLMPQLRAAAGVLYTALLAGKQAFLAQASTGPIGVINAMQEVVAGEPQARLDYAEIRDPGTFLPLEHLHAPALLLIAAFLGSTRLIDNVLLRADGTWDTGVLKGQ